MHRPPGTLRPAAVAGSLRVKKRIPSYPMTSFDGLKTLFDQAFQAGQRLSGCVAQVCRSCVVIQIDAAKLPDSGFSPFEFVRFFAAKKLERRAAGFNRALHLVPQQYKADTLLEPGRIKTGLIKICPVIEYELIGECYPLMIYLEKLQSQPALTLKLCAYSVMKQEMFICFEVDLVFFL